MRPHTAIMIAVYLHLLYKDSSLKSLSGSVTFAGKSKTLNVTVLSFDQETKSAEIETRYSLWSCIGRFKKDNNKITITHSGSVHKGYARETFTIYSPNSVGEGQTIGSDKYPGYFKSEHVDTGGYKSFIFEGPYIEDLKNKSPKSTRYEVRLNF